MLKDALTWAFVTFSEEFRQGKKLAFELVMFLSLAHFFGLYNPKQLADFLQVHQETIRTWVAQRKIPHYKIGRKSLRFDLDQIRKWLQDRHIEPSASSKAAGRSKRQSGEPHHIRRKLQIPAKKIAANC